MPPGGRVGGPMGRFMTEGDRQADHGYVGEGRVCSSGEADRDPGVHHRASLLSEDGV